MGVAVTDAVAIDSAASRGLFRREFGSGPAV
jgi:hypothetical protein